MTSALTIRDTTDLKKVLASQYQNQITNYFGDDKKALKFLSSVISAVQKTPKLLECDGQSVVNSFMTMAQLELMPSDVSGEAYVIPYKNKGQFQLGYQGLVTLFYRAGVRSITAEIVYKEDKFEHINGEFNHNPDVFSDDRGEAIGAYVIIELQAGGKVSKVMSKKEIMKIGKDFSKSFSSEYSPWNEKNDPQLWMWKKTVLKQSAKLVPKNETIFKAIGYDNEDGILHKQQSKKTVEKLAGLEIHEAKIAEIDNIEELTKYYKEHKGLGKEFTALLTERKNQLTIKKDDKKS